MRFWRRRVAELVAGRLTGDDIIELQRIEIEKGYDLIWNGLEITTGEAPVYQLSGPVLVRQW